MYADRRAFDYVIYLKTNDLHCETDRLNETDIKIENGLFTDGTPLESNLKLVDLVKTYQSGAAHERPQFTPYWASFEQLYTENKTMTEKLHSLFPANLAYSERINKFREDAIFLQNREQMFCVAAIKNEWGWLLLELYKQGFYFAGGSQFLNEFSSCQENKNEILVENTVQ